MLQQLLRCKTKLGFNYVACERILLSNILAISKSLVAERDNYYPEYFLL